MKYDNATNQNQQNIARLVWLYLGSKVRNSVRSELDEEGFECSTTISNLDSFVDNYGFWRRDLQRVGFNIRHVELCAQK